MAMKHDISSDDCGSDGSNDSNKSEKWVFSVSDNTPTSTQDVVEGEEQAAAGNTQGEKSFVFEIEEEIKEVLDEKENLAMIISIKDCYTKNPKFFDTSEGINMLYFAFSNGLLQVLQFLLKTFAMNGIKQTPLHAACQHNQLPIVQYLLVHGCRINAKLANGYTPFHIACEKGCNDNIVELSNFVKNNNSEVIDMKQNDDWTGLHLATRNGHTNNCRIPHRQPSRRCRLSGEKY